MRYPIKSILATARTVAMVGASSREEADSNLVLRYLTSHGYRVFPINPHSTEILGHAVYKSLKDLPEPPDVVQVFRPASEAPPIVDDAIAIGAGAVWMQLEIVNRPAAKKARAAGLLVVMDRCMKREHERLSQAPGWRQAARFVS